MSIWDDFHDAERFLEGARNGYDRPIANNTRIHRVGEDCIGIHLHSTDVIRLLRDGSTELNSGGWRTVTTANRIGRGRFQVGAGGIPWLYGWLAFDRSRGYWFDTPDERKYIFSDHMVFDANGCCISNNETLADAKREHKAEVREMRSRVAKLQFFTRIATDILEREGMRADPTDCTACFAGNGGHIAEHVLDREVPAALIFNALAESKEATGDPRALLGMHANGDDLMMGGQPLGHTAKVIRSALYRYIDRRVISVGANTRQVA